ncbi:MAG: type II secretion system protein, partial [Candidatus Firestonebacteria bacterium]
MKKNGLTFIELVISLAILAVLASVVFPLSEIAVKRAKESELRNNLREIRTALDNYKENYDKGAYGLKVAGASGYPKTMEELLNKKLLRKIPLNPITGKDDWGTRSFSDKYDTFISDKTDVFDVFADTDELALDGTKYKSW